MTWFNLVQFSNSRVELDPPGHIGHVKATEKIRRDEQKQQDLGMSRLVVNSVTRLTQRKG